MRIIVIRTLRALLTGQRDIHFVSPDFSISRSFHIIPRVAFSQIAKFYFPRNREKKKEERKRVLSSEKAPSSRGRKILLIRGSNLV